MSFICDFCGQPVPHNVKPVQVITEKREKNYPPSAFNEEGAHGWEIVKSKNACCQACIPANILDEQIQQRKISTILPQKPREDFEE